VIAAPLPCNAHLQELRTHLRRNLGALWLSYAARAAGDITDGLALLVAASEEAVLANARGLIHIQRRRPRRPATLRQLARAS
jgi:hypothetical protein